MPKTLADINAILGKDDTAELTLIIADIKAAVRSSDAGVIADLQKQLADAQTANTAALQSEKDKTAASEAAAALVLSDAQAAASAEAARLQAEADAKAAELLSYKADVQQEREEIKAIVADPSTVLAKIAEKEALEAKPEHDKAIAAAQAEVDVAQAKLDALIGVQQGAIKP